MTERAMLTGLVDLPTCMSTAAWLDEAIRACACAWPHGWDTGRDHYAELYNDDHTSMLRYCPETQFIATPVLIVMRFVP